MCYKTRDLGILIDSEINFKEHIYNITASANHRTFLIKKCFLSKDTSSLVKAFKVYVRPLVEYCSPVWSPSNTGLITKLEAVQRRFTKSLSGMSFFYYSERLRLLNLDFLEMRRLRADLMLCFKMLKGFADVDVSEFFEHVAPDSVTRGHRYKLVHPSVRINGRQHFLVVRIIPVWNSLSSNVVEVESISCFEARLSREGLTNL